MCVKVVAVFQMWMNVAMRWILVTLLFLKSVLTHKEAMSVFVQVDIVKTVLNNLVKVHKPFICTSAAYVCTCMEYQGVC